MPYKSPKLLASELFVFGLHPKFCRRGQTIVPGNAREGSFQMITSKTPCQQSDKARHEQNTRIRVSVRAQGLINY